MASTLACLDDSSLRPIVAFLDAYSISRLLICGCTSLSAKISRSTTHFKLEIRPPRQALFPKILRHLPALTHVEIGFKSGDDDVLYSGVIDYTLLPPSVKHLKLTFAEAFLSLITLPSTVNARNHQPRLAIPLAKLFPNLEQLELWDGYSSRVEKWDCSDLFIELFGAGSTLTHMSTTYFPSTWSWPEYARLPPTITSLEVSRSQPIPASFAFPPHLKRLYLPDTQGPMLPSLLPTSLTDLTLTTLDTNSTELKYLLGLQNLVTLNLYGTEFVDNLAVNLPQSLENLHLHHHTGDFESLLKLNCPVLRLLDLRWKRMTLGGATYNIEKGESWQETQPDVISNSAHREVLKRVISHLPRTLRQIPEFFFEIIYPEDWKLLPRMITGPFGMKLVNGAEQSPYFCDLPPTLTRLELCNFTCDTLLQLPMTYALRSLTTTTGNDITRDFIANLNRFPNLCVLDLRSDSFDLSWLDSLTIMLQELWVRSVAEQAVNTDGADVWDDLPLEPFPTVPKWARVLEGISLGDQFFNTLPTQTIHWLLTLPTLKHITASAEALLRSVLSLRVAPSIKQRRSIPRRVIENLPPNLKSLLINLEGVDSEILKILPAKLEMLALNGTRGHWKVQDLQRFKEVNMLHLPPTREKAATFPNEIKNFVNNHPTLGLVLVDATLTFANRKVEGPVEYPEAWKLLTAQRLKKRVVRFQPDRQCKKR